MRPTLKICASYLLVFLTVAFAAPAQSQINFPGLGSKSAGSKQQANDEKTSKLLHEKLPLVLDANTVFPTVPEEDMIGGPFHGQTLPLTLDSLTRTLPPGDYILPMTFFCSEYSIHRPGAGTAYELAPAQGTAAKAISTLLWRGMLSGHSPQELQAVSWAIQGSVSYDKMPAKYKVLIDQLIPDMKNQVNGKAFADIKDGYQGKINEVTEKVSSAIENAFGNHVKVAINVDVELNDSFKRLGRLGQMALDGESVASIVTDPSLSDEARERTLYAGAGTQAPRLPAANGPWSVMIPGAAYMRFVVHGGNLHSDNEMQIRVLPQQPSAAFLPTQEPHLMLTGFQPAAAVQPTRMSPITVLRLFGGTIGVAEDFAACSAGSLGVGDALGACQVLAVGGLIAVAVAAGTQIPVIAPAPPMASTGKSGGSKQNGGGNPSPSSPSGGPRPPNWIAVLAARIARGHAFDKHVLDQGEFRGLGVRTEKQLEELIEQTIEDATQAGDVKSLARGRTAYWDTKTDTVVIEDPANADGGTVFRPKDGKSYFDRL